jgi:hypothetical protein
VTLHKAHHNKIKAKKKSKPQKSPDPKGKSRRPKSFKKNLPPRNPDKQKTPFSKRTHK